MGVVNRVLTKVFYCLGERIAKSPKYFVVLPIVFTFVLATGLLRLKYVNDPEYLYTETNGKTHHEKEAVERLFHPNYKDRFDPSRISRIGRFARLIVTSKNEDESLLNEKAWNELLQLDNLVHSVTISWKGDKFNYSSMCASWFGNCFENEFLDIGEEMGNIENGTSKLSYPIAFNSKTFKTHVLPQYFGGVTLKEDKFYVDSVKAVLLNYVLAVDSTEDNERGRVWERKVVKTLNSNANTFEILKFRVMTYDSLPSEMDYNTFAIVPHFVVTTILMAIFTILTSMHTHNDWVKSKPWLGLTGGVSAILGTIAGGGIVCFMGIEFHGILLAIPFLMLGIGIDDTFVMLASWRRTSPEDPVPKRLAECYSDAAVSVTITTLTDMVSFYVGALTTIPSIQIFSLYAGTCIICIYIYQLCFFGGIMAISGYHEAQNRHSVLWWIEAVPKSKADSIPKLYRMFLTGGVDKTNPSNPKDTTENAMMVFFRDTFSDFIFRPSTRIFVLLTFVLYIAVAAYGITKMEVGLRPERIVRFDSYVAEFLLAEEKYFRLYPHRIQVVVDTPMDFSQKVNQDKIDNLLKQFYKIEHISELWTENWLRDFTRFVDNYSEFFDFNVTNEVDFINTLRNEYLNEKSPISLDILFNENKTQILATRYIIQSQNVFTITQEKDLVVQLREVCDEAKKDGLTVSIYQPLFHFDDQFIVIGQITTKLVAVAAVVVMAVAIIFIPNLICSISVLFSIVSIEIGVLGFMSLWQVNLDLVSVICIIMCIGFSVDFSAHISYAFISSEADTTREKMREAMFSLGLPVMQGGISTIIGIAALVAAPSYIYQVFFKIGVLVIVFAVWHALFLLPVLLLLLQPGKGISCCWSKSKSYSVTNSSSHFTNNNDIKAADSEKSKIKQIVTIS